MRVIGGGAQVRKDDLEQGATGSREATIEASESDKKSDSGGEEQRRELRTHNAYVDQRG